MKKISYTLLVFSIIFFGVNTSYANSCSIQDGPSEELALYFKNLNTISKNIRNQSVSGSSNSSQVSKVIQTSRATKSTVRAYNSIFDFQNYASALKYYTLFPIRNKLPNEFKRDFKELEKARKRLENTLNVILDNGKMEVILENPCSGITDYCNMRNIKSIQAITKVMDNHEKIVTKFTNAMVGIPENESVIFLTNPNIHLDFIKNYGKQNVKPCNSEEGEFSQRTEKKIASIKEKIGNGEKAIQNWEDAWNTVIGKDMSPYQINDMETKLLRKELKRQGIGGNKQQKILRNLERFNIDGGFFPVTNIVNTVENLSQNVTKTAKIFIGKVGDLGTQLGQNIQGFGNLFKGEEGNQSVSNTTITKAKNNQQVTIEIVENITDIHKKLELSSAKSENTTDKYRDQLINIHLDISKSITILRKTCKNAVKICNLQSRGKGKCGRCN